MFSVYTGLKFLTCVCCRLEDDWNTTTSTCCRTNQSQSFWRELVAKPWYALQILQTVLLQAYLKIAATLIKIFTNMDSETARKNYYQIGNQNGYLNAKVWNVREVKHIYEVLLQNQFRLHSGWTACSQPAGLARCVLPPPALAMLKPARNVWVGHNPFWFPRLLIVRHGYSNLKRCSYIFKRMYVSPKENSIQIFYFFRNWGQKLCNRHGRGARWRRAPLSVPCFTAT
jgi:hypothetical protein